MLKNSFYNIVGTATRLVVSLLTVPFLVRIIGLEEYGLWVFSSAVIGIVALAEGGLSISTTVFVARDLTEKNHHVIIETLTTIVAIVLTLATLAALILWYCASFLVDLFVPLNEIQNNLLIDALRLGALVVWGRLLQQVLIGLKQAYQSFGLINILQTSQSFLANIGMLIIAWYGGRVVAFMQWQAFISFIFLIVHCGFAWGLIKHLNLYPNWNMLKCLRILRYSAATWIGLLGSALFSQFDRVIIGALLGPKLLGVYGAITSITVQINTFSAMAIQPHFPIITQLMTHSKQDLSGLQYYIKRTFIFSTVIALCMGSIFFAIAPLFLQLLLSETSHEYVLAFRIMIVIYAFYSVNVVGTYILFSADAVHLSTAIIIISGILSLSLIALGAIFFGFLGAIMGNSAFLLTLGVYGYGMKKVNLPVWEWITWSKFLFVWFGVGVTVVLLVREQLILSIVIALIQQIVLVIWLVMTQQESIRQMMNRLGIMWN